MNVNAFVGMLVALVLVRGQREKAQNGHCVEDHCYTVHKLSVDFNSARTVCESSAGHLMTVGTTVANDVISYLLTGYTGHFWIGLEYKQDFCADSTRALKGYAWITGYTGTTFTNWKRPDERVCSRRCVSLSRDDPKWTERLCDDRTEGFLCQYANFNKCGPLASASPVLYETPFGFAQEDLREVPHSSNATRVDLRTRHICLDGKWLQAPWSCEVYKGGCEQMCVHFNHTFRCTCPPGYKLENNEVSCAKVFTDPCVQAGCSHLCVAVENNYDCRCNRGYELGKDGKTCKDVDECDDKGLCPGEHSYCANTAGGFDCRCETGFKRTGDTCEDDDECASGPCDHRCVNAIGGYHCECDDGYTVSSKDRHKCVVHCSQWECPAMDCDYNNQFQCNCPSGFIFEERDTGNVCIDIDECVMANCDQNCTNTPGHYICSCDEGFDFIDNAKCVRADASSTTTTVDIFAPTSRRPPVETASLLTDGGLLGITVCSVMLVVLIVCVGHHNVKRCREMYSFTAHKAHNEEAHALQQVSTEKYTKNLTIANVHFK